MDNFELWYRLNKNRGVSKSGTPPLTFKSNGRPLKNYRIYGNTVNGESVGDLVTEGEHAGEYCVPVTITNGSNIQTTNLYLPEQIRKVGDEIEYIDYKEQKLHRIRKNLLKNIGTSQTINGLTFTVCDDGSIVCNGRATQTFPFEFSRTLLSSGAYKLCGNNNGNSSNTTFRMQTYNSSLPLWVSDEGRGATFELHTQTTMITRIVIYFGYNCENLIFNPMIIRANITNDTYEPYINDTELDVTLPALPTLSGTNTLSVGTEVQPSSVEITMQGGLHKSANDYFRYKYDIRSKGNAGQF